MADELTLRRIRPEDDAAVANIIRTVMPEFGACGAGFAINDAEVGTMCSAYSGPRQAYFVLEQDGVVVGGGGIAPLAGTSTGSDSDVCELRKMYFLPVARGKGQGERVLRSCLDFARGAGFHRCYLETLTGMNAAMKLYEKLGFTQIPAPLGNTGHFSCDRFYLLEW